MKEAYRKEVSFRFTEGPEQSSTWTSATLVIRSHRTASEGRLVLYDKSRVARANRKIGDIIGAKLEKGNPLEPVLTMSTYQEGDTLKIKFKNKPDYKEFRAAYDKIFREMKEEDSEDELDVSLSSEEPGSATKKKKLDEEVEQEAGEAAMASATDPHGGRPPQKGDENIDILQVSNSGNTEETAWSTVTRKTRVRASNKTKEGGTRNKPDINKMGPIVLTGIQEAELKNPLVLKKRLDKWNGKIKEIKTTSTGKVIAFPNSEADRDFILTVKVSGITARDSKPNTSTSQHFVVMLGVNPDISEEEVTKEINRPCKRLLSAKLGGNKTWKIKVTCNSAEEKKKLIKDGLKIGWHYHRVIEFEEQKKPIVCYNCQNFGHIATNCKVEMKCRYCAENHASKECSRKKKCCANCGQDHEASDSACPIRKQQIEEVEFVEAKKKQTTKKAGDKEESIELANIIVSSLQATLSKSYTKKGISESEICEIVVRSISKFRKIEINSNLIRRLVFG